MKQLMTGNEALARGAWEAGVHFAAAYPGTPSTEIMENISTYPEITSEWSPTKRSPMKRPMARPLPADAHLPP